MAAKGSFANTIKFLIRRFEPVFRPVPGHNSVALRVSSIKETLTGDKEKLKQNDGVESAARKKRQAKDLSEKPGEEKGRLLHRHVAYCNTFTDETATLYIILKLLR
jgi:hypothetical protein